MAESPFPFLRATFYRWVQLWPQLCPELANARLVLGVGDLHVENFGTWRDSEGRLIWGVNDFDEACRMPYTNDLVRLAVSAALAVRENRLSCGVADVCDAILTGYREALEQGGLPFVLSAQHRWLRDLAISDLRDPTRYWEKLGHLPRFRQRLPDVVQQALRHALPEPRLPWQVVHRRAGLGSLGRRRFTVLADWRGGKIAREAKELVASAWGWERAGPHDEILYQAINEQAVRAPDPFVSVHGPWLIRRLAPDCSRIELSSLAQIKDELRLLRAMGWETGNIHLGTKAAARAILHDLGNRPAKWLCKAAEVMSKATLDDWKAWSKASE
jgi:uncharacterized protein (DUF2252 family)